MNNELDKKKEEFLENIGEYHRNVVQLLQNTRLTQEQLDSTKACTIDSMRARLDRVCVVARDVGFKSGVEHGNQWYTIGYNEGFKKAADAFAKPSEEVEKRGFESGKACGITEGRFAGYGEGYTKGVEDGKHSKYDYREAFSKGYDAGKKAALKERGNTKSSAVCEGTLNDPGRVATIQPGPSYDADSFIRRYGFPTFDDLTGGNFRVYAGAAPSSAENALLGRTKWNAWPLMLRHDYVQARICDGVPMVQIVVNGEQIGVVAPSGVLLVPRYSDYLRFKSLAMHVAKHDSECDHATNVRVPDSKVGLFLFIDSKGNEFELKNTEYGTVIVKGDLVLGVVSSKTAIEHTHGALQQCDEYGKLTQAVFAFVKWACNIDHRALPRFMLSACSIEQHVGFYVRIACDGEFEVIKSTGALGVRIRPNHRGTLGVTEYGEVSAAAIKTIRSKFYGNMVL